MKPMDNLVGKTFLMPCGGEYAVNSCLFKLLFIDDMQDICGYLIKVKVIAGDRSLFSRKIGEAVGGDYYLIGYKMATTLIHNEYKQDEENTNV